MVEIVNLIENDIGDESLGADRRGVIKFFSVQFMRVVAENFALAGSGADFRFDTEQHWDVLERMQTIGDEKWHYYYVGSFSKRVPIGDERLFFHVGIEHGCVTGLAQFLALVLDRLGAIGIEVGAVAHDDERGLTRVDVRCDFACSAQ